MVDPVEAFKRQFDPVTDISITPSPIVAGSSLATRSMKVSCETGRMRAKESDSG